jgi:hypothetical protein
MRYTKEQLIFFLKKLASEKKKSPTIKDVNCNKKLPSSGTYFRRFGSWNNSLREAGLKVNVRKQYSKQELIDNLKHLYNELARTPKSADLKSRDWIASYTTYKKYFSTWRNALREAGIVKKTSNLREFVKKK